MEKEIYVLEYSPTQKAYNIDTLENVINKNNNMYKKGIFNDYILIAYSDDKEKIYSISNLYIKMYDRP